MKFDLNSVDKTQPERLSNDSSHEDTMKKYAAITDGIKKYGMELAGTSNGNPVLVDRSCDYQLTHNIMTWQIFKVDEVVAMIVSGRDSYLERKNETNKSN